MRNRKHNREYHDDNNPSHQIRDDKLLAIYMTVVEGRGMTTAEIAKKNNITSGTALIDLLHYEKGGLIEKRGGKWYWSKNHNKGNEK